jgi:hypothetical protein
MPSSTGKKGSKKAGRMKSSPSQQRYNSEGRCEKNKKRKAKRVAKAIEHGRERSIRNITKRAKERAQRTPAV